MTGARVLCGKEMKLEAEAGNLGLRNRTHWLPRLVAQGRGAEGKSESKMATHFNKESSG